MSLPDPTPARKHPQSKNWRLGLWLPFAIAGVAVLAWSGLWIWARGKVETRLDAAVAEMARAGYQVSWKTRVIGGYPFRLDITLTDARLHEPAGWALETPRLEAEGFLHAPRHWVLATPQGLTFVRPQGGPVAVTGQTIRASLTNLDKRPPSFSFQGIKLAFAPVAGAQPYFLSAAEKIEFHLRAGPDDEGGVFLQVDGGKAGPAGLFANLAGAKPIAIQWNSTTSKMSAFKGATWAEAVRAWTAGGGRMTVRTAGVTAGDVSLGSGGGSLGVGSDGRLRGTLALTLRQAPRALAALGQAGLVPKEAADAAAMVAQARQTGDVAKADLVFEAGQATLGPVALGPAPRIYAR
jgi:hypothetical protein